MLRSVIGCFSVNLPKRLSFSSSVALKMPPPVQLTNPSQLLDHVDTFLFDCDGVIWRGDDKIEGVSETIEHLRNIGKRVVFVTNNSTKSRVNYMKKFKDFHVNVQLDEMFSSSFAAALYLTQSNFAATGKKVYVIGGQGIIDELEAAGITTLGGPQDADKSLSLDGALEVDPNVGAVVVGLDVNINYYKIQYAQLCINSLPGCQFIATNLDATKPHGGQLHAGGGSMVGAIRGCTGREPIVVGKPSSLLVDHITSKYNMDRSKICMVGDRLDTDILFGLRNGMRTCLTLSGVTSKDVLCDENNTTKPEFFVNSIYDFLSCSR